MGLRDILRAVREFPAAHAELETTRAELRQTQQALEQSEQKRESLWLKLSEQEDYMSFLSRKSEALQTALETFCPKLSTAEDMKRFYDAISPDMDSQGFTLYHIAEKLTGIDVPSLFSYEDNRGLFEEMDGHQLLNWLTAAHFQAVDWTIIPGSMYEAAELQDFDTSTPEYQAFEKQLYEKVLERMGFQDILAPSRESNTREDRTTELKLYSPLSGGLTDPGNDEMEPLDGRNLLAFQTAIRQDIEKTWLTEEVERGLMLYFDGPSAVDEKVVSLFPAVEEMNGELYGVAVCQIRGTLSPGELEELKEYCRTQYNDAWGEEFAQRPRRTGEGDLYVSFYIDSSDSILTKEELETAGAPSRAPHQPKERGEQHGR